MNAYTERRLVLFAVMMLLAVAVVALYVVAAGAATATTQLQRAPFVAAGSPPPPATGDGGGIAAIGPVVAASNEVLARAPFAAVPLSTSPALGSATTGVAGATAVAVLDGTKRAALGAPVPGPLVVNAAPISTTAGLAILGGSLLALILIAGATAVMTSGHFRPQVEYGSVGSVMGLDQRPSSKPADTDQHSRRKAA
jgi:hypothetical protein